MPRWTKHVAVTWKVVRTLVLVGAVSSQPAWARQEGVPPDWCFPEPGSGCEWGGGISAHDYYCDSWFNCETCCQSPGDSCEGMDDMRDRAGDGQCDQSMR